MNPGWWQKSVFYQVYLPSFFDGNDDGLGDFPGLISKVDYLASLGIGGLWITPFYPSPLVDNGYDISDYCNVDPRFGTLDDFRQLVSACHQKGIKIVIDLVLNHVSTAHPWFQDAWNTPASPYRDFFLFTSTPNNWQAFFSGSAWEKEPDTGQYYYHKFAPEQADLNWGNPDVEAHILSVIDFWIALGVDGFRFDVINFLTTDGIGQDNPSADDQQIHAHDINQPAILPTLRRLCRYIRQRGEFFLIGEVGSDDLEVISRYQAADLMDVVFNFNLGSLKTFHVDTLFAELQAMRQKQSGLPTLFFSSHDMPRMIGRFGECAGDTERARAVMMLQLSAQGVPFIFQGEEAGVNNYVPANEAMLIDIQGKTHYRTALAQGKTAAQALQVAISHSRDASRAPLPWAVAPHGGFTRAGPWMPLAEISAATCLEVQRDTPGSLWQDYQQMIALRTTTSALCTGEYRLLAQENQCIHFIRESDDTCVWVSINFGDAVKNPWYEIPAPVVVGENTPWIAKNHAIIKRSCHAKAQ